MKYIVFLMAFFILFSYPLTMLGLVISPSFTATYSSLDGFVNLFDNKLTQSLLSVFGSGSSDKTVSAWQFDENLFHDSIYRDKYPYLKDVYYILHYGKLSGRTDRLFIALSTVWKDITGKTFTDVNAKVYFCFDQDGLFLRLIIVSNEKLYYSDNADNTRLESSLYSRFQKIAYIKYNTVSGEINNLFTLKASFRGSIFNFVNNHLSSLGVSL